MRILFPTGLYLDKIPAPDESGSITWTISTEEPSRPTTTLQQYPNALQNTQYHINELDDNVIRKLYGELLITSTKSRSADSLSNSIQFEVGTILSQFDLETIATETLLIPRNIEIQHDNNVFDLKTLGLNDEEIELVNTTSSTKMKEIRNTIAVVVSELDVVNNQITETRKHITEANNSIRAISLTSLTNIKVILEQKLAEFTTTLNDLELQRDELEQQALELRDQLLAMSVLVR